ncbi:MAG: putative Ig domain-containing protein [Chloroflexota bacterium]
MDSNNATRRDIRASLANKTKKSKQTIEKFVRWMLVTAVFSLFFLPFNQTYSAPVVLYETDFETDPGWTLDPFGTDTAITGEWEAADPEQSENAGFILQPEDAASGTQALVTGATAGTGAGDFDLDGGVTSIRSPAIEIPGNSNYHLFFKYYFAHNSSADSADFLRVSIVGSSTTVVVNEAGEGEHRGAFWTASGSSLAAFAGQTIYILVEASDETSAGALIEAGIDDLVIVDPVVVMGASFDSNSEGFTYQDDTFRSTNQPNYATGTFESSGGISGGGLHVEIGGVDSDDIDDMSGGWTKSVTVNGKGTGFISFDYQLTVDFEYEDDEYGQVLISFDNELYGLNGNDYVLQIDGGAANESSGWQNVTFDVGELSNGDYTLTIGGYNNKKTSSIEITEIDIDNVQLLLEPDSLAPEVTNPDSQESKEGEAVNLPISATDPFGGDLIFIATGLPDGLSIDRASGLISGTSPEGSEGYYEVELSVSNTSDTKIISFSWLVRPITSGEISREWWTGISGDDVVDLTSNSNYPNNPSGQDTRTSFEAPTDWANNYGTRMRGYLFAPVSGEYTFWLATDDQGELRLSTDSAIANSQLIANVPDWAASREWDKFPEQESTSITLEAGQRYYIEVLQKEASGGDNIAVAWAFPGQSLEVIPGKYLIPYSANPVVTKPSDSYAVQGDGTAISIEAYDPNDLSLTYSAAGLPAGFSIDANTGEISGTLADGDTTSYAVTVTVSNGSGIAQTSFNLIGIPRSNEAGSVTVAQSGAGQWHVVNLQHTYKTAVIVMGPPSFNDSEPTTVRVRNVTNNSFEFQIDEWDYLDGAHASETIGYVVAEAGTFTLANGKQLLAGVKTGVTQSFTAVSFSQAFTAVPLVFTQVSSTNEASAVTTRIQTVQTSQFTVRVQEEEAGGSHTGETIHWIALEPTVEDDNFEAASTGSTVDEVVETVTFAQTYLSTPIFIATDQTQNGGDTVAIRRTILTTESAGVFIEEEASLNSEVAHADENVAYLVIEPAIDDNPFGQPPNEPPNVTSPGNQLNQINDVVSLQIEASDPTNDPLTYEATGLPTGLSINATTGLISGTVTEINTFAVEITVSDDRNGSTSILFSWQVTEVPNNPPLITNPGDQTNTVNDTVSLAIEATDADDDSLTFSAQNLPTGLSINEDSGLISGTATSVGSFATVVTVSDGEDSADVVFAWTINEPPNTPPDVTTPSDQVNIVGDSVSLMIEATDADDDTLMFSAENLPTGLSINADSGLISGTVSEINSFAVVVTVDDGRDPVTAVFAWTVNDVPNTPPSVTDPGDQANNLDDIVNLQIEATDVDDDPLTYAAEGLPTGLSIAENTGLISGTPTVSGPFAIIVTVDDGNGGSTAIVFSWTISEVPNSPPVITTPDDQTNFTNDAVSLQIEAVDADNDDLVYTAVNLPPGVAIDEDTGLISGTLTQSGRYAILLLVEDENGDSDNAIFNWVVNQEGSTNNIPEIVNPATQSHTIGDDVTLNIEASDLDNDTLTYSAISLPDGLAIDGETGVISGTVSLANTYATVVTVNDGNEGEASAVFIWVVNAVPNIVPNIVEPGDQSNLVGDIVSLDIEATDIDEDELVYSALNLPPGLNISPIDGLISGELTEGGQYAVIVTVDDGKGGIVNTTFLWVVNTTANTGPSITDPGNQTNIINDAVDLTIVASDPDSDPLTYLAVNLPTGLSINDETGAISGTVTQIGLFPVSISVDDGRGGVASTSFVWSVTEVPNNLPVIDTPDTQFNIVGDNVSLQISATDADGDALLYIATELPAGVFINQATGLITGQLTKKGTHLVEIAVFDGEDTIEISFIWQVDEPVNPFEINVSYLPLVVRNFRPDEPNDVCSEAATLLPNLPRSFAHEDLEDWYVFSIEQNEAITVQLSNFTAGGQMIVYSGNCSNLTFLQNNGNFSTSKTIDLGLSSPGTYYIRIITDDSYSDPTQYKLEVIVP